MIKPRIEYQRSAQEEQRTHRRTVGAPHTRTRIVPTSSSIIRRHGRVRFTVAISTGDRMVLSHFFASANRTLLAPWLLSSPFPLPPSLRARFLRFLVRSSLVRLPLAAPATQFPVAAASGWRVERTTPATLASSWSAENEVVMETHGPGYTLGHTPGNMADLLPFSPSVLPSTRASTISLEDFAKATGGGRAGKSSATRRETPWASGCISSKDPFDPPSATHPLPQCATVPVLVTYVGVRHAHTDASRDSRFSLRSTRIACAHRILD